MEKKHSQRFPVGKLPIRTLERLLKSNRIQDPRVIVGPGIREDAAVIDTGGPRYLIVKTDPITFTANQIGWYAVHINANDIATMGARPLWYLATLLLPEDLTTPDLAEQIFHDTRKACKSIGVSLVGGHTEVTSGLGRPIVVGQMLGEVEKTIFSQSRELTKIDLQSQENIALNESQRCIIDGIRLAPNDVMIMVVEQDPCARASLSELLSDRGHRVVKAADGTEAIQRIEENVNLELILLDLETTAAARMLKHARRMSPNVIVFGMSRHDALHEAVDALHGFFFKPLVFQELYREICAAGVRADRCKP